MTDAFPHVARRRDRIEPSGECTREEARKRLRLLKPLLEVLGAKLGRPGLLSPMAIDSIGTLLCPPASSGPMAASNPLVERYRKLLTDAPPDNVEFQFPRVRLQLRTHETISVEDAEQLETRKRLKLRCDSRNRGDGASTGSERASRSRTLQSNWTTTEPASSCASKRIRCAPSSTSHLRPIQLRRATRAEGTTSSRRTFQWKSKLCSLASLWGREKVDWPSFAPIR